MADELQWLHFFDHTGGLNTRNTPTTIPIFDATDLSNVEGITKGGFRKIDGYARYCQAPLLASGTYLRGNLNPTAETDAWTGAGIAATRSIASGILTLTEDGAGADFIQYYNAEAGFTTGTDACCERRSKIRAGYTASGVYVESLIVLDDGTKRFELVALDDSGTKKIGVLTDTADRTVIGSYSSLVTLDWSSDYNRYRVSFDGGAGNTISVYVNDMTSTATTIGYSSLPASTETSRVAFGSFVAATTIVTDTDYLCYKIGSTSLDTTPFNGIYSFIDETDTQVVIATAGTKLYQFLASTNDWAEITGGTALTAAAKPHFVTFNDTSASNNAIVIITTESRDKPQKWDGTTRADLGGTPPQGKFCAVYNERLFIANTSADPTAVYYSALGDPEDRDDQSGTWDTTNDVFLVNRHVYGDITGLVAVNNLLLIFSRRGIHRFQGWGKGSFQLDSVTTRNGCIAPNSIVKGSYGAEGNEGVYFRDKDGYYWTNGEVGRVIRVSEKILPTLRDDIDPVYVNNECAFMDASRNIVGFSNTASGGSVNSATYMLDYLMASVQGEMNKPIEGWFPSTVGMRACATVRSSAGRDVVLFADQHGLVHTFNSGTDFDGDDYAGNRSTAWMLCGAPHMFKMFRSLVLYSEASGDYDLNVEFFVNFSDSGSVTRTINLTPSGDVLGSTFILGSSILGGIGSRTAKVPIDLVGNSLRVDFSTSLKDQPFYVYGFSIGYEMMEDWFDSDV